MTTKDNLFNRLKELNIEYKTYDHEPLFTVEQAAKATAFIPATQCKNLFLKDDNLDLYLVTAVSDIKHETKINLKNLSKYLKAPKLRFADEQLLKQFLGVMPGSVTPFGLINDIESKVKVILDSTLFEYDLVGFHPLENTQTTVILAKDLKKFIESCSNLYQIIDFENFK